MRAFALSYLVFFMFEYYFMVTCPFLKGNEGKVDLEERGGGSRCLEI